MVRSRAILVWLFTIFCGFALFSCGSSSSDTTAIPTAPNSQPVPPAPPAQEVQLALPSVEKNVLPDSVGLTQVISEMGIGINLGNTLDAPIEGEWALEAQEYYIQAFQDAGFQHVRIPITWGNHIQNTAPYRVDPDFMDRVEQIVDWVLDRDLYAIVNVHHDAWIKENYTDISQRNRFDSIWIQVAERFKHKSAKLLFEIINEPRGLTVEQLNELNKRALAIIRNETVNRIVVFAGNEWSHLDDLYQVAVPDTEDEFLMANFHNYDPWGFAGICTQGWGSQQDRDAMEVLYARAHQWSLSNQIPIMMNEFGSAKFDFQNPENVCDPADRAAYLETSVAMIKRYGFAATFWDDGGSFSTYDRTTSTWGFEKDILTAE